VRAGKAWFASDGSRQVAMIGSTSRLLGLVLMLSACAGRREVCSDFDRDVEEVWSTSHRARIAGVELEVEFAREVVHRVTTGLDGFALEWIDQREQACRECVEQRVLSTEAYNRIATCLDVALVRQQTLVAALERGDLDMLAHADGLFEANVDLLRVCRRAATDPRYDSEARQVREALELADAAAKLLDYAVARAHAGQALAAAEAAELGPAMLAEVRIVHARMLGHDGAVSEAEAEAELAEQLARRAQDNRLVVAALVERSLAAALAKQRGTAIQHAIAAEELARATLFESEIHATALANFAGITDDPAKAITAIEQALKIRERLLGRSHFDYADTLRQYGGLVLNVEVANVAAGQFAERGGEFSRLAIPPLRAALEILSARLGPNHPALLSTKFNLSAALANLGRHEEALRLAGEALDTAVAAFGDNHRLTVMLLSNLATIHSRVGDLQATLVYARRAEAAAIAIDEPSMAIQPWLIIATCLHDLGRFAEALEWSERAVAALDGQLTTQRFDALALHGRILLASEKWMAAIGALSQAISLGESLLGPDHDWLERVHLDLALALIRGREFRLVATHLQRALAIQEARSLPTLSIVDTLHNLGWVHVELGEFERALELLDRAVVLAESLDADASMIARIRDTRALACERAGISACEPPDKQR
jgi:tetratricopeptide (TPR) repeat protein